MAAWCTACSCWAFAEHLTCARHYRQVAARGVLLGPPATQALADGTTYFVGLGEAAWRGSAPPPGSYLRVPRGGWIRSAAGLLPPPTH